jgi:hypothetical protein
VTKPHICLPLRKALKPTPDRPTSSRTKKKTAESFLEDCKCSVETFHTFRGEVRRPLAARDRTYVCLRVFVWRSFLFLQQVDYEGVSKSFRTGRLERELQMVQLSATRCSCIAIL